MFRKVINLIYFINRQLNCTCAMQRIFAQLQLEGRHIFLYNICVCVKSMKFPLLAQLSPVLRQFKVGNFGKLKSNSNPNPNPNATLNCRDAIMPTLPSRTKEGAARETCALEKILMLNHFLICSFIVRKVNV